MQMLALMEKSTVGAVTSEASDAKYANRYPRTYGHKLGVLTDVDNTPLQMLSLSGSFIDVTDVGSLELKSFFTETSYVEGNGTKFQDLPNIISKNGKQWMVENNVFVYGGNAELIAASTTFQNLCSANGQVIYTDINGTEVGRVNSDGTTLSGNPSSLTCAGHIVVCSGNQSGYVLSACNLGAATVGATNVAASYGSYYQWGNNWGGTSTATTSPTRPICSGDSTMNHTFFVTGFSDWCSVQTDNVWGSTTNMLTARRGPCAEGYHVPEDWSGIINVLTGSNGINISNALKLPFAGSRDRSAGTMLSQGTIGLYWASKPISANASNLGISSSIVSPIGGSFRASGFSVRCLKN